MNPHPALALLLLSALIVATYGVDELTIAMQGCTEQR